MLPTDDPTGVDVGDNNRVEQGRQAMQAGRYKEAALILASAVHHQPTFADAHNYLGFCLSMIDEPVRAEAHFQRAIELNPDYAQAHMNLAILMYERREYTAARGHLRQFNRIHEGTETVFPTVVLDDLAKRHATLAREYKSYGLMENSEKEILQALRLAPGYPDLRLQYAQILFDRTKLEEAAREIERILKDRPGYSAALLLKGRVEQSRGNRQAACLAWESVRIGKDAVQARTFLRLIERPMERFDSAQTQTAMRPVPGSPLAKEDQ